MNQDPTPIPASSRRPNTPTWLFLAVACIAQFMVVLDVTVVNVALPAMKQALGLSIADQQWIINAYTLTFGGFLLFGGRAADLFGRKTIFMVGLSLFTLSSLVGGFAQSGAFLIAARAVQGIGGAILAPATLSLLTSTFTDHKERARALTVWGTTAASGAAVGTVLGGVLTDISSWRAVLFINVPIGLLLLATAAKVLLNSRGTAHGVRSLDIVGTVLVTGGLGLVIYGIVTTDTYAWGSFHTLGLVGIGLLAIIGFLINEAKITYPLMPLRMFANKSLRGGNVVAFLVGAAIVGFLFFLSLYLQQVDHYSAIRAGLGLLPSAIGTFSAAIFAGKVAIRLTPRRVIMMGALSTTVGILLLSRLTPSDGYLLHFLVPSMLSGMGMGFCFVPMTMAGTAGVAPSDAGIASGLLNTSRQLGAALGLAVTAAIAASRTTDLALHHVANPLSGGFDEGLFLDAVLSLAIVVAAALLLPKKARLAVGEQTQSATPLAH